MIPIPVIADLERNEFDDFFEDIGDFELPKVQKYGEGLHPISKQIGCVDLDEVWNAEMKAWDATWGQLPEMLNEWLKEAKANNIGYYDDVKPSVIIGVQEIPLENLGGILSNIKKKVNKTVKASKTVATKSLKTLATASKNVKNVTNASMNYVQAKSNQVYNTELAKKATATIKAVSKKVMTPAIKKQVANLKKVAKTATTKAKQFATKASTYAKKITSAKGLGQIGTKIKNFTKAAVSKVKAMAGKVTNVSALKKAIGGVLAKGKNALIKGYNAIKKNVVAKANVIRNKFRDVVAKNLKVVQAVTQKGKDLYSSLRAGQKGAEAKAQLNAQAQKRDVAKVSLENKKEQAKTRMEQKRAIDKGNDRVISRVNASQRKTDENIQKTQDSIKEVKAKQQEHEEMLAMNSDMLKKGLVVGGIGLIGVMIIMTWGRKK